MNFEQDDSLKNRLIEALMEKYGEEREEIHVSDLIYCLREAYYRKIDPHPPNETELMFYVDGARRHLLIEELSGEDSEVVIDWKGVKGTIDLLGTMPVEIKTTRANRALPPHYFQQLGYYCAMLGVEEGLLLIQRLNNREEPWEFWRCTWNKQEIERLRLEIQTKRETLERGLFFKDASVLPKSDLLGDDGKPWKCRYCKYIEQCKEA